MESPKGIDIKSPGTSFFKSTTVQWIVGGVAITAVMIGGGVLYKKHRQKQRHQTVQMEIQSEIDPSYLEFSPPEEESLEEDSYFDLPENESENTQAASKQAETLQQPPTPQQVKNTYLPPSPDNLFTFAEQIKVDHRKLMAKNFNAMRATGGESRILITPKEISKIRKELADKYEYENTQEDYRKEEGKIKASFPVDLSRVLTEDKRITCVVENDIASELAGKITMVVRSNVYAKHGSLILIPAGSKVVGNFIPFNKIGQERLEVGVSRIITPRGINIHFGNGQISDAMGRSGITGEVDRRYMERYGMAFTLSLVNAVATYSIPVNSRNEAMVIENTGGEMSSLSKAVLADHMSIKPTVNIPHGSIVHISPPADIWFRKPVKNIIKVAIKNSDGEWK